MKNKTLPKQKVQPKKVANYYCTKCNELLLRNYPYSPYRIPDDPKKLLKCTKCLPLDLAKHSLPF